MDTAEIVVYLILVIAAFTIGLIIWDLRRRVIKLEKNNGKIIEQHKIKIVTCMKCGNHILVNGTLGTSTQPVINVFEGNTNLPIQKLKQLLV